VSRFDQLKFPIFRGEMKKSSRRETIRTASIEEKKWTDVACKSARIGTYAFARISGNYEKDKFRNRDLRLGHLSRIYSRMKPRQLTLFAEAE
jgi:hypothetical protein